MSDVTVTGTYAMLMEKDGPSVVEARAWKLAATAGKPATWRDYLDEAKAQLLAEYEADQVDISTVVEALKP